MVHDLVEKQTLAANQLDAEHGTWVTAREAACKVEPVRRTQQLLCLDGVLARINAVAHAVQSDRDGPQVDAGALLIDPRVCEMTRVPRLITTSSPELLDVMAAWLARTATSIPLEVAAASTLVARTANDPCASSLARLLAAGVEKTLVERSRQLDEAQQAAESCGDDRILADTAIFAAQQTMDNEWLSPSVTSKLRRADVAAQRVAQSDLAAQIEMMRVESAKRAEDLDEAIARGSAAMDGFAARNRLRAQIDAGLSLLVLRQIRGTPADLTAIPDQLTAWRTRAVAMLGAADDIVRAIDARSAEWAFAHGDVAGAHSTLERLWRAQPNDRARRLTGIVVDGRGKPAVGATVTAGRTMRGDSISAAGIFVDRDSIRAVKTGGDGRFEIADAADDAVVVAELGNRRSPPLAVGSNLRLVLMPTSRLEGRIQFAGQVPANVSVVVRGTAWPISPRYSIYAPVAADGSFTVSGVPRTTIHVRGVISGLSDELTGSKTVSVRDPVVRGVVLSFNHWTRVVHVLVRNTVNAKLANAEVVVLPGRVSSTNALEMKRQIHGANIRWARQLESERLPRQIGEAAQPGDLFATMVGAPDGPASACAMGLPALSDEELERTLTAHLDRLQVICSPIPENADIVIIAVPPFPRLE